MARRRSKSKKKASKRAPWRANPTRLYTEAETRAIHRKLGKLLSEGFGFAQAYAIAVKTVAPKKARGVARRTVGRMLRYAR